MKVLFYNHTAKVSGAEKVLLMVLTHLDQSQFTPLVLCPSGALKQIIEEAEIPCLEVEELKVRFTWRPDYLLRYGLSFWHVMSGIRNAVRLAKPDVVHANGTRAGLVMIAATSGMSVPVICHLHELLPAHPLSVVIRAFILCSARLQILAVSHAAARSFQGLLWRLAPHRVSVKVIHNAVTGFQPDKICRQKIRQELELTDQTLALGIVGNITANKGQLELIQAFAKVVKTVPQAQLLIIGAPIFNQKDHDYDELLRQTAQKLELLRHVKFIGYRTDIPELLQAIDILIVNSESEACPLVVLEGMLSQAAIIATAVGGIPEILQHNVTGLLIPPRNEQALIDAIRKLSKFSHRRTELAANARQKGAIQFSVTHYSEKLGDYYQDLVRAKNINNLPALYCDIPSSQASNKGD